MNLPFVVFEALVYSFKCNVVAFFHLNPVAHHVYLRWRVFALRCTMCEVVLQFYVYFTHLSIL